MKTKFPSGSPQRPCSICLLSALLVLLCGCVKRDGVGFDIPEGKATETLVEFARQANVEIIFDPETVEDLKTRPVFGKMRPVQALELMIPEKRFSIHQDPLSHAIAIKKLATDENIAVPKAPLDP